MVINFFSNVIYVRCSNIRNEYWTIAELRTTNKDRKTPSNASYQRAHLDVGQPCNWVYALIRFHTFGYPELPVNQLSPL